MKKNLKQKLYLFNFSPTEDSVDKRVQSESTLRISMQLDMDQIKYDFKKIQSELIEMKKKSRENRND